jgi:hypothetical protein
MDLTAMTPHRLHVHIDRLILDHVSGSSGDTRAIGDAVSAAVIRALASQPRFQALPLTLRDSETLRRQIARQVHRRLTR